MHANHEQLLYYAENALKRLNYACRAEWEEELMTLEEDEIGVFLSDDGRKAAFCFKDKRLTDAENEMLLTWALFERGETTVYAPPIATHALDEIAGTHDGSVEYFKDERDLLERLSKSSPVQFAARTDGIYAFLLVLDVLSDKNIFLDDLLQAFPHIFRVKNELPLPDEKRAAMLGSIRKHTPGGFEREESFYKNAFGYAWLEPDEKKPVLSVVSEARDMETAQEICDVFSNLVLHSMEE